MNTQKSHRALTDLGILLALWLLYCLSAPYAHSSSLLSSRMQEYADLYPDIHFLHVQDNADITMLPKQLGEDAKNLDYEHYSDIRDDLLQLQYMRIKYLLENQIPSATLFKTGINTKHQQPFVCAITLNESQFLNHPNASTQIMLSDHARESLASKKLSSLDNNTFLLYTLDHEVYHCLDSYLHGHSISKGSDKTRSSYEKFLSEYRADLYASLKLRQSQPSAIAFLRLLASYRIMGLVDIDTEHYTVAAIQHVINTQESSINNKTNVDLARDIRKIARLSQPEINQYTQLINTARGLALILGLEREELNENNKSITKSVSIDESMLSSNKLKLIIQEYEQAQSHITSNIYLDDKSSLIR